MITGRASPIPLAILLDRDYIKTKSRPEVPDDGTEKSRKTEEG